MENTDRNIVEEATDSDTTKLSTGETALELKILEIKLVKLNEVEITKATQPEEKDTEKDSNSSERNLEHADDEGEDLPENFFDDFSNKDFMAGLDIVDDWIDDGTPYFADDMDTKEVKPAKNSPSTKKNKRAAPRSRRSRSHHRTRRSRSKDRDPKHRSSRNRDTHLKTEQKERDRSKDRGEAGQKRRSKDRKRSAEKDAENDDARRDPEKTKRDIQRDKIRFTKDQEQKVFIEQLKVAETGLVPPGTELDVVLESERKKKEDKKHEERKPDMKPRAIEDRKRPHGKSPMKKTRSKSRGREARRTSRERRRESRERRRSRPLRSRSRRRSRESPRRRSRESPRRLSPLRRRLNRSRSRTYSPKPLRSRRSRSLEELYRRNDDLRLRIREKRRERYLNDLSPVSEPRLSRSPTRLSPISHVSEREVWLRNKYRSRYGRSCSPISSSSLSDHGSPRRKRSKKSSFMEEIQRKLRDQSGGDKTTFDTFNTPFKNTLLPVPAPTYPYVSPFQNNQMFPPAPQMCPNPYQQPALQPLMAQPCMPPQMLPIPNAIPEYRGQMVGGPPMGMAPPPNMGTVINLHQKPMQLPGPPKPVQHPSKMGTQQHVVQKPAQLYTKPDAKELTKLFEEQKISLSDYLSVSAKPIDPKAPINVHVKVKAISKCQEVIRVINERSKHNGRFFPIMSTASCEKPTEIVKWKSPLRKVFPMRFNFTTQSKKPTTVPESNLVLINKFLAISGLPRLQDIQTPLSLSVSEEPAMKPTPAPTSLRVHTPVKQIPAVQKPIPPAPKPPVLIKRSSIGVQTDPIKCQICELRKAMQFNDHSCQTVPLETLDECTQVCVEDLNKSCVTFTPRGILKNSSPSVQSISHLTPAQLLQMQREKEDLDNPWGCGDTWNDSPYSRFSDQDPRTQFKPSGLTGNTSFNSKDSNDPRTFKSPGLSGNSSFNTKEDPRTFKPSGLSSISSFNTKEDPRPFKTSGLTGSNFIPNPNRSLRDSFLNVNTSFNKSSFSSDKLPFSGGLLDRSFSLSSAFDRGGDSYTGGDRFGAFGNDRYSPEQNFSDSSSFVGGNSARGRGGMGGRGFSNAGSFSAPNRPFYGSRGGHN